MKKLFFGYTRVSTAKQGQGVSLQEQRAAVQRFAQQHDLEIVRWFEERKTAAKDGRPIFNEMVKLLKRGAAEGLITHKIDRSARNLRDWLNLTDLIDQGVAVHFAHDNLDMTSRGGRLSADVQAVVAADYIRNLHDEAIKGFYGRLKQGVLPLPAPVGYLDCGAGRPKALDPERAPLVRRAFELYATGEYSLHVLTKEIFRLGLRNRRGGPVTLNGLSIMLNNVFYVGLIRIWKTGEVFQGAHPPLITQRLFDRVQQILKGKAPTVTKSHDFVFRRLFACKTCGYSLIGEKAKQRYVYYRCHTRTCPVTCIPERAFIERLLPLLDRLQLSKEELAHAKERIARKRARWVREREQHLAAARLVVSRIDERLTRLTDIFIDGGIDKEIFDHRKTQLLVEKNYAKENLASLEGSECRPADKVTKYLELAKSAALQYKLALPDEKRRLVLKLTSNRVVDGKKIDIALKSPFAEIASRSNFSNSGPYQGTPRTFGGRCDALIKYLWAYFEKEREDESDEEEGAKTVAA